MSTVRRLLAGVVIGLILSAGVVGAQGPFTAQIENFWRLISTGGRTFTTISITTANVTSQLNVGSGGTNTLPIIQKLFFSFSADTQIRMVLENRSATTNADTELKLINGLGTAFLGVCNVNSTGFCGANTNPAGAHRSWLDLSDNTAGAGWDIGGQAAALVTRFYTGGYTAGNFRVWIDATALSLKNSECIGAEAGTAGNDATISRTSASNWVMGNGTCGNASGALQLATLTATTQIVLTNSFVFNTPPTVGSGFGGTPSIPVKNGSAAFTVNVGSGGAATNGVLSFGGTAANGYRVSCDDVSTQSSTVFETRQIAFTNNSATIANFNTAGSQAAWVANDILVCNATAF